MAAKVKPLSRSRSFFSGFRRVFPLSFLSFVLFHLVSARLFLVEIGDRSAVHRTSFARTDYALLPGLPAVPFREGFFGRLSAGSLAVPTLENLASIAPTERVPSIFLFSCQSGSSGLYPCL